jgi:GT2 family glycosyltransferase
MRNSISVIIPSWNSKQFLDSCINSILKQTVAPLEILIVDNGSNDGFIESVATAYPLVKVVFNGENLGVATAWNIGARISQGSILGFVNQDIEFRGDWLEQIECAIELYSRNAIIGSKLMYPDGKTIQHAGGEIHYPTAVTHHRGKGRLDIGAFEDNMDVDYVTGAAFAMSRELFDAVGGFDQRFYPAYFEDVDFCVRARILGYHVVYFPKAVAVHHESTSLGKGSVDFLRAYHLGRLRFVLKYIDTEELLEGFVDEELHSITEKVLRPFELEALKWVYHHDDLIFLNGTHHPKIAERRILHKIRLICEGI